MYRSGCSRIPSIDAGQLYNGRWLKHIIENGGQASNYLGTEAETVNTTTKRTKHLIAARSQLASCVSILPSHPALATFAMATTEDLVSNSPIGLQTGFRETYCRSRIGWSRAFYNSVEALEGRLLSSHVRLRD